MAKTKKKVAEITESFIEAVDLISLLTPQGLSGLYEREITQIAHTEGYKLPDLSEFEKPSLPSTKVLAPKNDSEEIASFFASVPKQKEVTRVTSQPNSEFIPIAGDTLEKVAADIFVCEKCELYKTRNKTVPGEGSSFAKLMLIGEAPGGDEDSTGIPFVGKAGQHLDNILAAAGFKRDEVFICNILKCRPPGNRDPYMPEMVACTDFLKRQIQLIQPKLIACFGNVAIKYIIGPNTPGITRIHGQWLKSIFNIPAMPMYHPSYLLRYPSRAKDSPNWQMWQDIKALKQKYDSV